MPRWLYAVARKGSWYQSWRRLVPFAGLIVLLGIVGGLAWVVLGRQQAPAQDEFYARVRASGVLRICLDASFPPFEFIGDNQQVSGFDPDLSREIANRMSLRVQFINTGFDSLYAELAAGHCDIIISALPYDKLRTRDVGYSDIYFMGGEVLVVSGDGLAVPRLSEMNGRTIGVELGTPAEALARRLQRRNGYQLRSFSTMGDAATALERGDVHAVLADAVSARLLLRTYGALRIADEPVGSEPNYVAAVPVDAPAFLAAINSQLRAMVRDNTLKQLMSRWF
jgi:ABC-type amino acid transport substrate-binding protein